MTWRARRTHSLAFEVKVAIATIKGDLTLSEQPKEFEVYPNQITAWKSHKLESAVGVFCSNNFQKNFIRYSFEVLLRILWRNRDHSAATPTGSWLLVASVAFSIAASSVGAHGQVPPSVPSGIAQAFRPPWSGSVSPDGLWRIAGPWTGSGGNQLDPSLARLTGDKGGALLLSVAAHERRGAEIQTLRSFGYGYYEVKMQVTSVSGVVASFFWIEEPHYGPHEWDIEFLTNEPWITSDHSGLVHLTLHPSNTTFVLPLPFNPSKAFHRYGFLWTPGKIVYTVDGHPAHTFVESDLTTSAKGYIMMNTWTGNSNWGGGPPKEQATTAYSWVQFNGGATTITRP